MAGRSIDRTLWFAVLAPPAAWTVDTLASITLEQDYCASHLVRAFRPWGSVAPALYLVAIGALALSLYAGFLAWRLREQDTSEPRASGNGRGATVPDRQRFMANAALLVSALFTFGILLRGVTPLWLPTALCYTR